MKHQIKKGIFYLVLGFVFLFCLRLGYGYIYVDTIKQQSANEYEASGFDFSRKNYASAKLKYDGVDKQTSALDQKYEKIASVASQSKAFEQDEKNLRDLAVSFNSLIQYEQSVGLAGKRKLNLAIGVPPNNFDAMVGKVKEIGSIVSLSVNKTDKTNEYKTLNARKVSLEKTRDALITLKTKGGRVDESINLEEKILEIENELQSLGVSLGEFDKENEFCTVKVTLLESGGNAVKSSVPFLTRIKVAFEWTVKFYLRLVAILFIIVSVAFVATLLLEKLKWLPSVAKDFGQKSQDT